jgi:hypothetical protein
VISAQDYAIKRKKKKFFEKNRKYKLLSFLFFQKTGGVLTSGIS